MYVDVPTNVSVMELMSSPDTPKSQILMCPFELHRMFDGLMSGNRIVSNCRQDDDDKTHTTVNYPVYVVEVRQSFEHGQRDFANDIDVNRPDLLVYSVQ